MLLAGCLHASTCARGALNPFTWPAAVVQLTAAHQTNHPYDDALYGDCDERYILGDWSEFIKTDKKEVKLVSLVACSGLYMLFHIPSRYMASLRCSSPRPPRLPTGTLKRLKMAAELASGVVEQPPVNDMRATPSVACVSSKLK